MGNESKIEWTDSTFNPWIGCTKVGPGCDHCYAEAMMDTRMGRAKWGHGQQRKRTSAAYWRQPIQWNARSFWQCGECGWRGEQLDWSECPSCNAHSGLAPARRRVFCASLADVFDNEVPASWRCDLFDLIRFTPHLDWLLLTKRVGNVRAHLAAALDVAKDLGSNDSRYLALARWLNEWLGGRPPKNAWLGATVVNQAEADRDIPKLLSTPAAVRFLSVEPMLGPVRLDDVEMSPGAFQNSLSLEEWADSPDAPEVLSSVGRGALIDWIICGGESGKDARPMHPDWARSLRDQCFVGGVPFLFKQWGEWAPMATTDGIQVLPFDDYQMRPPYFGFAKRGKQLSGRTLDGRTHDEFPSVRS